MYGTLCVPGNPTIPVLISDELGVPRGVPSSEAPELGDVDASENTSDEYWSECEPVREPTESCCIG